LAHKTFFQIIARQSGNQCKLQKIDSRLFRGSREFNRTQLAQPMPVSPKSEKGPGHVHVTGLSI